MDAELKYLYTKNQEGAIHSFPRRMIWGVRMLRYDGQDQESGKSTASGNTGMFNVKSNL